MIDSMLPDALKVAWNLLLLVWLAWSIVGLTKNGSYTWALLGLFLGIALAVRIGVRIA